MIRIHILNRKMNAVLLILYIVLGIATYTNGVSIMLMITLMVWMFMLAITVNDLKNNIASFCFLISIYVFLLGREVLFYYFGLPVYYKYLTKQNDFAYLCIIISMIGLLVGNSIDSNKYSKKILDSSAKSVDYTSSYVSSLKAVSRIVFFICYFFQVVALMMQILFVRRVGYIFAYSEDSGGAGIPSVISYIGAFMPMALFIYLATKPSKKEAIIPLVLYELYGVLTLLSGRRFPFVAINMLIIIYLVTRSREESNWLSKNMIITALAAVPVLMIFLAAYDSIRIGKSFSFTGIADGIVDFFDGQGGSINIIKRVKFYSRELSNLHFCSFDGTRTLLTENLIVRKLFDVKVYSGNSIEHALKGHSLSHRLSYYNYGEGYLKGQGVGSCYIGELYHDFSYIGILLGSMAYGHFFRVINRMRFSNPVKDGIVFVILYYILLAPRGGFDGFVENVFGIYSLLGLLALIYITRLVQKKNKKMSSNVDGMRIKTNI